MLFARPCVRIFLDARLRLWVSLKHSFMQAEQFSSTAHLLARRGHKRPQPGGHMHKEAVHLLTTQPASITSSSTCEPECNGLSQFKDDTDGPSMPV